VNSIVEVYYATQKDDCKSEAFCFHCLHHPLLVARPALIPIEQIAAAFTVGLHSIPCPSDPNVDVWLELIGPDVCLSHLPQLSNVALGKELARGAFGTK